MLNGRLIQFIGEHTGLAIPETISKGSQKYPKTYKRTPQQPLHPNQLSTPTSTSALLTMRFTQLIATVLALVVAQVAATPAPEPVAYVPLFPPSHTLT